METWRPVVGYEGHYEVSDQGRVNSLKSHKIMKPTPCKREGRPWLTLSREGKPRSFKVYTLVLRAFVGDCPPGHEACHFDGDTSNSRLSNLRWGTPAENLLDKIRHGTTTRGEKSARATLTQAKVDAIRADMRLHRLIAADYGINESTVTRIRNFTRWPI